MKSIDIKSLLIGILGTALVMVLMGASNNEKNIGKFQASCAVGNRELNVSCLVFDTQTGNQTKRVHCWGAREAMRCFQDTKWSD